MKKISLLVYLILIITTKIFATGTLHVFTYHLDPSMPGSYFFDDEMNYITTPIASPNNVKPFCYDHISVGLGDVYYTNLNTDFFLDPFKYAKFKLYNYNTGVLLDESDWINKDHPYAEFSFPFILGPKRTNYEVKCEVWNDVNHNGNIETGEIDLSYADSKIFQKEFNYELSILNPDITFIAQKPCFGNEVVFITNYFPISYTNNGFNDITVEINYGDDLVYYKWFDDDGALSNYRIPNIHHTYLSSGTYTVTMKIISPCGIQSYITTVTVPTSILSIIPSDIVFCNSNINTITAIVTPPTTFTYDYVWSSGETTPTITPTTNGLYTVTVTNSAFECTSTASYNVNIITCCIGTDAISYNGNEEIPYDLSIINYEYP
ncbi:MAG: hypothetical protein WCP57_12600 [Bacteroidota bacterium]